MRLACAFALAGLVLVLGGMLLTTTGRPVDRSGPSSQAVMFVVGVGFLGLSSARGFGVAIAAMRARRSSAGALTWAFGMLAVVLFLVSIANQDLVMAYGRPVPRRLPLGQLTGWAAIGCAVVGMIVGLTGVTGAVSRRRQP